MMMHLMRRVSLVILSVVATAFLALLLFTALAGMAAAQAPACTSSKTTRLLSKGSTWLTGTLKVWYVSADSVASTCTKFPLVLGRDTVWLPGPAIHDTVRVILHDTVFVTPAPPPPPPPPPPAQGDTTLLVRAISLKPDSISRVAGSALAAQFCVYLVFRDGRVPSDPTAPAECLANYGGWYTMGQRTLSPAQRARADSLYSGLLTLAGWPVYGRVTPLRLAVLHPRRAFGT